MVRRKLGIVVVVGSLLICGASGLAQDKGAQPAVKSAEEEAMMKEYDKWAKPGEAHKLIEKMAGKWDVTVKMWMDPSAPPAESKGTSVNTLILGGRWLRSEFKGDMMGQPFEGVGMYGYDNFKQRYISIWTDNMSTMMIQMSGTANAEGTEIALTGIMDEPTTGERDKKVRSVLRWAGADRFAYDAYDNIPGKGEIKVMEITYNRAK